MPSLPERLSHATRAFHDGKFAEARTTALAVVRASPENAAAWKLLGAIAFQERDLVEATRCFQKVLRASPDLAAACYHLALVLQERGDLVGAAAYYRQAIALNPRLAAAHNNLGNVLRDQGDTDGAIECYRRSTALAHLAGALGVGVWLALPHVADWRWLRKRSDSPWYPTMTLFRQKAAGEWGGVFEDVLTAGLKCT